MDRIMTIINNTVLNAENLLREQVSGVLVTEKTVKTEKKTV